ncbi:MAG: hypothetical protein KKC79_05955 [Gammaproteobacteria bacterium]|nr:hypothetical protein [Gammaproteobacteria bacterium]MBU1441900.1 hypothetical protein [Gammaproteobacteria bacterium]MBU2285471.1 hypothetical protein [Gammaproteobacteria bacterium]MBU2408179.1 hypothetical protein [Gammaproteobacteria bacterium]
MNREAIYCFDTATVRFALYPSGPTGPRIIGQITEDALRDLFGARGGGDSLVAACRSNFDAIEAKALERYRAAPSSMVTLTTKDFASSMFTTSSFADLPAVG